MKINRDDYMPTSSISANFNITKKRSANLFAKVLTSSKIEVETPSKRIELVSRTEAISILNRKIKK